MKTYVLFHANCADGFCSAWVARNAIAKLDPVMVPEFIPVQHGQPIPSIDDKSIVYILDFSYAAKDLLELAGRSISVVVLDHHKTAAKNLEPLAKDLSLSPRLRIVFDMEKSGAMLTWEWFNGFKPAPWLVRYCQDRDLWTWKLRQSKAISAFLASYKFDFNLWDDFSKADEFESEEFHYYVAQGAAILRYQSTVIDSAVSKAVPVTIDGHSVLCVNATTLISEIGEKLADGKPFAATFFYESKSKKYIYSLRSREGGLDVSEIAKKFGGGGHAPAAGFAVDNLIGT